MLDHLRIIARMRSTWSGLATDWEGFEPIGYFLGDRATKIRLKCVTDAELSPEGLQMSLGELFRELSGCQFGIAESDHSIFGFTISVEERRISVSGPSFNVHLARVILELVNEGKSHLQTKWFCYSKASCLADPHERYDFFVTVGEDIVRESVTFSDYHGSGFDPAVFEDFKGSERLWSDDEAWLSANEASLYRRFYSTTRTGRLMLLRPDRPTLYYITREDTSSNTAPQSGPPHVERLLWLIALLLALIALLLLRH